MYINNNMSNIQIISEALKAINKDIRIVGGAVRDHIIGIESKDIDIATTATPDEQIKAYIHSNLSYIPTGIKHGTITVIVNNTNYEVTTLRIDTETDGRHASVEWTSNWIEDAARRDLTINSISMDLNGNIYDPFNGVNDLKNGIIKFVGNSNDRIQEDYLRILRYVRFYGRYGNEFPSSDIIDSITNNIRGLNTVSGERIWSEVKLLFLLDNEKFKKIKYLMDVTGLWQYLGFAEFQDSYIIKNDNVFKISQYIRVIESLDNMAMKWKISTNEYNKILYLIKTRLNSITLKEAKKILVFDKVVDMNYIIARCERDNNLSIIDILNNWSIPHKPINGNDIINTKQNISGINIGIMLKALYTKWVDSDFSLTKQELLEMIK